MELSTLVEAAVPATHHRNQDSDGARAVPVHTIPHIENPGAPPSAAALGASSDTMDHAEGPIPAVGAAAQAPGGPEPKTVRFELVSAESPQYRARLPMRVQIYPHDTTESIVTTVKNFYGLYSSHNIAKGVSFEDQHTNTLIARYENFRNNMVVYVRVIEEPAPGPAPFPGHSFHPTTSGTPPFLNGDTFSLQAPQQFGQHISRPGSRTSRKRSLSPNSGRGRRSASASTNPKARSRSSKTHGPGSQGQPDCADSLNGGYSSGDGASGSVSGRSKEHLGNTEISLENIVEGGRRKRAKFESSELPLFAPPQMPAATSNPSVSPARRADPNRASLQFVHPGQSAFAGARALQSPHAHTGGFGHAGVYATPMSDGRRTRTSIGYPVGIGIGSGPLILPTPDPTVGSCMSEEDKDVAMQLMRLGEVSNISYGRTSASTQDDTFSGKADAASSTGATSDADSESEDEEPPVRKQRLDNGDSKKIYPSSESHFVPLRDGAEGSGDDGDYDGIEPGSMAAPRLKKIKTAGQAIARPRSQSQPTKPKSSKPAKPKTASNGTKVKKSGSISSAPMSPNSLARKLPVLPDGTVLAPASTGSVDGDDDQLDLSAKPRCQRCRKSKKGCDRQRPCGRCKDAGIPADLCISEDEGNGRKGRYGRHMGVPIKKDELAPLPAPLPMASIPGATAAFLPVVDKNKKRKR